MRTEDQLKTVYIHQARQDEHIKRLERMNSVLLVSNVALWTAFVIHHFIR